MTKWTRPTYNSESVHHYTMGLFATIRKLMCRVSIHVYHFRGVLNLVFSTPSCFSISPPLLTLLMPPFKHGSVSSVSHSWLLTLLVLGLPCCWCLHFHLLLKKRSNIYIKNPKKTYYILHPIYAENCGVCGHAQHCYRFMITG